MCQVMLAASVGRSGFCRRLTKCPATWNLNSSLVHRTLSSTSDHTASDSVSSAPSIENITSSYQYSDDKHKPHSALKKIEVSTSRKRLFAPSPRPTPKSVAYGYFDHLLLLRRRALKSRRVTDSDWFEQAFLSCQKVTRSVNLYGDPSSRTIIPSLSPKPKLVSTPGLLKILDISSPIEFAVFGQHCPEWPPILSNTRWSIVTGSPRSSRSLVGGLLPQSICSRSTSICEINNDQ